jgi:transposase-like protein
MPKSKYSNELKQKVVAEFAATGDAESIAKNYGITTKSIYNWKSQLKASPAKDTDRELKDLRKKLALAEEENKILKEIVKKTFQVGVLD